MNVRLKWLRNQLKSLNLDGMLVSNPINIKYLTGLEAEGTLVIAPKENVFITDSRYIEDVNNKLTIADEIVAYDGKKISKYDYEGFFMICENIGFEETYVTYADYQKYLQTYKVNLVETEEIIERQRTIKEESEIECIKKACEITDKTFEYIIRNIKKGMTEKQVAFEIERYMIMQGADGLAFETIVASGENSSMPHAIPTDRVIKNGDILLFDMGAKYKGYCSDLSRTIFVGEDAKLEEEYNFVSEMQKEIYEQFKAGVNIKPIIKEIEAKYQEHNYEIMHAFGHGVGLNIHEKPVLRANIDKNIKENMVLAIEPGIYEPGKFGIRIEDTFLVTENKCENLTKCNKGYIKISLKA